MDTQTAFSLPPAFLSTHPLSGLGNLRTFFDPSHSAGGSRLWPTENTHNGVRRKLSCLTDDELESLKSGALTLVGYIESALDEREGR